MNVNKDEQAKIGSPNWDGGRFISWEYYVGDEFAGAWNELSADAKFIAYCWANEKKDRDNAAAD